jgi:hypothetical protein
MDSIDTEKIANPLSKWFSSFWMNPERHSKRDPGGDCDRNYDDSDERRD